MRTPKAEKEDPAVVAAREREQARAEATRTEETQALLVGQTQRRLRRYGKLPGSGGGRGGSVPIYGPAPSAASGGGASSGGGSVGGNFGGDRFGGGTFQDVVTQVY